MKRAARKPVFKGPIERELLDEQKKLLDGVTTLAGSLEARVKELIAENEDLSSKYVALDLQLGEERAEKLALGARVEELESRLKFLSSPPEEKPSQASRLQQAVDRFRDAFHRR